eukprot:TRINITY_DN34654_c0_g1_i1.p1 TRINITY_DN34654_c0_g1~~TRINITY_DN34654_c0_g1_i1.p1  ORF type:complete len:175 (+),score=20.14 TRINITY_DN34654_c0_g1_i1:49-573(+)
MKPVQADQQFVQPFVPAVPDRNNDRSELIVSLLVFILGWCLCPVWLGGCCFLKSRDTTARVLAYFSLALGCLSTIAIVVLLALFVINAKDPSGSSTCKAANSDVGLCVDTGCGVCVFTAAPRNATWFCQPISGSDCNTAGYSFFRRTPDACTAFYHDADTRCPTGCAPCGNTCC